MKTKRLGTLALLLAAASALFADITITPDRLVIKSTPEAAKAANTLAEHLKLMTGKTIPVNPQAAPTADAYVITVGRAPEGTDAALAPEEARWLFTDKEGFLYGEGPFGTRHAVHFFLESELGVRWPYGDEIVAARRDAIIVRTLSNSWMPQFQARNIRDAGNAVMRTWCERMREGSHNPPPIGHSFIFWWKNYHKTHPEYFALVKGQRTPLSYEGVRATDAVAPTGNIDQLIGLCTSNDAVVKQVVENWRTNNGVSWNNRPDFINGCENDVIEKHICHCDTCNAQDADDATRFTIEMGADRTVIFHNRILAEARKFNPNVKVTMYAALWSALAPKRPDVTLADGVVIGYCPDDFRADIMASRIEDWRKKGMKEFYYRPNRHHYYQPMGFPLANEKHCFEIFQLMRKYNAVAFDYDATGTYDVFRWHNDYILEHAMMYPDQTFQHWEDDFCSTYGAARQDIADYFAFWRNLWDTRIAPKLGQLCTKENRMFFSRAFFQNVEDFYTDKDFAHAETILKRAAARTLTADERRRLGHVTRFNSHARIMLKAITEHTVENSQALIAFRKANGLPEMFSFEKDYGDRCDVKMEGIAMYPKPVIDTPLFWHFRLDYANEGEAEQWFRETDFSRWDGMMPTDSAWEQPAQRYEHPTPDLRKLTAAYDGVAWYACKVDVPKDWKGKRRVILHFGAVDEAADVWVNGKKVGSHPFLKPDDWECIFTMDITDAVDWTADKQLVTVKVTDKMFNGGIWKRVYIVSKFN